MGWLADETGLEKCAANYVPLTPLSHLKRAAQVFSDHDAVIYKSRRFSYAEYAQRVTRLASVLKRFGVGAGDIVSTLLPNIPAQAEAHFGVPACGAVLNTINTRLDVDTVAYIFDHANPKIVLVDTQFLPLAQAAIDKAQNAAPKIIEVCDTDAGFTPSKTYDEYEDVLALADENMPWDMPSDEWESLALNYTSGTTGRPKGVVYHHRGAYLMTMGTVISWRMTLQPRFLAIVPLFHCNGWTHIWLMPLVGGTVVCCRDVSAKEIYDAIATQKVTHFGGAPIVLNMIVNAPNSDRRTFDHTVEVITAGAPPAPATLAAIEPMGFNITQVYGLTETFGHVTECLWNPDWDTLPQDDKAAIKARQGVAFPMMEDISVFDEHHRQIPMNAEACGEIGVRGNCVMKGYFKNPDATHKVFSGGYFRSGDIAVQHPDGMIQVTDRAKDIIISGGENISSVEIEGALMAHRAILLCAVVAKPDEKWGETPCAFVELKPGMIATEQDIIAFARERLAGFKTPKMVIFETLPKTSTGKIQKFELRKRAKLL